MKRFIANVLWVILSIPFYVLILASCFYSACLTKIFKWFGEKIVPFDWIDKLDSWIYNKKQEWL